MSTGYSGNLGFPLPKDWAFDQIATITVGSGTGFIEIDKDVASGRDTGQTLFTPRGPDTALDVRFDMSMRSGLISGLVNYIVSHGYDDLYRARSAEECASKVLDMDALITGLARSFRMRKSLMQAVIFWEYQADVTDEGVDAQVDAYYSWKEAYAEWEQNPIGLPPSSPSVIFDDSSTGVAQIFGRTAIRARNHCIGADVISGPIQDPEDWRARRAVWNQLRNDDDYNVSVVPLIHIWSAARDSITTDRLSYSDDEIFKVLSVYNGSDEYGFRARDLYNIFEAYNAVVRG